MQSKGQQKTSTFDAYRPYMWWRVYVGTSGWKGTEGGRKEEGGTEGGKQQLACKAQTSTRPQNFSKSKANFDFCNNAQKSNYRRD